MTCPLITGTILRLMHFPPDLIEKIARHHGFEGEVRPLPNGGMVNEAWAIGEDLVLRITFKGSSDDEAALEEIVVPIAVAAEIRTPKLVVCDISKTLAPRPYTIYERAEGTLLGYIDGDPETFEPLYRDIGREIARLGRVEVGPAEREQIGGGREMNVRRALQKAVESGAVPPSQEEEIGKFINRLERQIGHTGWKCLVHQDFHPWNIFVDDDNERMTAVIDWGDAGWGDPAVEFSSMPLVAYPAMLAGFRAEGGYADHAFEMRSLLHGLGLALWEVQQLPIEEFDRRWWRMPPGGWEEMRAHVAEIWPDLI